MRIIIVVLWFVKLASSIYMHDYLRSKTKYKLKNLRTYAYRPHARPPPDYASCARAAPAARGPPANIIKENLTKLTDTCCIVPEYSYSRFHSEKSRAEHITGQIYMDFQCSVNCTVQWRCTCTYSTQQ